MHINIKWISVFLLMIAVTANAENTTTNLSSEVLKKMNSEELIQLFSHPKWGDKAFFEIADRIRKDNSDQNGKLGKLLFQHWAESEDAKIKGRCFQGLRILKSQETVDYLIIKLLEGSTRKERISAARDLGVLGNTSAVPALESAVSADKGVFGEGRSIAETSIFALGKIGEPAVQSLMRIWGAEKLRYDCEESIISAMGQTKDKRFTPVLIEVLNGNNEMIRDNAAWALGEIGDDTSIPALRKLQEDPNAKVKENVLQAISKIERNKLPGVVSQPTTNQTVVVVPESGKTNDLKKTVNP